MGITDANGNLIANYTYDEWGKVTAVTATGTNLGISYINSLLEKINGGTEKSKAQEVLFPDEIDRRGIRSACQ